jgi:hypothetical protein
LPTFSPVRDKIKKRSAFADLKEKPSHDRIGMDFVGKLEGAAARLE